MELRDGEKLIWEGRPTWRAMLSFYIKWGILALLPAIVVAILNGVFDTDISQSLAILATIILLVAVVAIGWLLRIGTYYLITDHRIMIRRGILSRRERSASIDRVQNVNTSQTFIERMLNTGRVDFDTAGSDASDADLTFVGIDDPHGLRDKIDIVTQNRGHDERSGL
jgi:uncharacterized membrane protein YdbT with pleckstrin-like domain